MDVEKIREGWRDLLEIVQRDAYNGPMLSMYLCSAKVQSIRRHDVGYGYRVTVEVIQRHHETLISHNAEYWLAHALREQFDEEIEVILVTPEISPISSHVVGFIASLKSLDGL